MNRGKQHSQRPCHRVLPLAASSLLLALATSLGLGAAPPIQLELRYQKISGAEPVWRSVVEPLSLDPARMAIVVVDMWDGHGCGTMIEKEEALIPRLNETLQACRDLNIQVLFAPSDFAHKWANTPQRKNFAKVRLHPLPASNGWNPEKIPGWGAPCMCPVREVEAESGAPVRACQGGRPKTNQHPDVVVKDEDLMLNANGVSNAMQAWNAPAQIELYSLARERGITHILYVGCAANLCVVNREFAMVQARRMGLFPIVIRDLTHALTFNGYNPETKRLDPTFTPTLGTDLSVREIERYIGPSIESRQLLEAAR